MAFTPERVSTAAPHLSPDQINALVEEEASFGRVAVDARGLTPGTILHVLEPWRAVLAAWQSARNEFDQEVEPKIGDILALDNLKSEIESLQEQQQQEVTRAVSQWLAKEENNTINKRWEEANEFYYKERLEHGQRDAVMRAYHWSYWLALMCIGAAEWLINYDTFFLFLGVPAIAAGATIILGVLLAFAAHGYGELLKQWSYRFGAHQGRMNRTSAYRLLALSTLGLGIVLLAAGASRYAAALHSLAGQPVQNILGSAATVDIDPTRDVLISLLANLGAWVVGVFIAYFCHDVDPVYMAATRQHRKAQRKYIRARRNVEDEIQRINASAEENRKKMEASAKARAAGVATERAMLDQVNKQEAVILDMVASSVRAQAEQYRNAMARFALAALGGLAISRVVDGENKILSPYEYRALPVIVDMTVIRDLMR